VTPWGTSLNGGLSWASSSLSSVHDRDESGRERSGKPLNHSCNHIFLPGTGAGTGKPDGKTKAILRDIGRETYRSGTC
jgi:hypothetical protein